jgi:pimeloyl-ACP methyl ester carboxylesterase
MVYLGTSLISAGKGQGGRGNGAKPIVFPFPLTLSPLPYSTSMVYLSSRIRLSAGQMFWREAGDRHRPAIVFLHGSWHDGSQWEQTIEPLSKNFHCLAPDLLGVGNSTANPAPTSIDMEVDRLHEFIIALKLHSVYLVGHSLGAWIALSFTLKYPDLVRGVVTIAPEGFSVTSWQKYSGSTKFLLAHPWLFRIWLNGLKAATSVSDNAYPLAKSQAYWNFFKKYPNTCRLLFQRSAKEIRRELVADRLAQFRPPLLVLQSDKDERSVIEQSQACARAVGKAEFKLIKAADFTYSQESMRQVAREIQQFLDRVQAQIDLTN